jgi:hypothetical protein
MTTDERIAALERQLEHEKAERQALQQLVIPPLTEVRKDLQLNVEYLTERLEALKARPAGNVDDGSITEDLAGAYDCLLKLLKLVNGDREHLDWLTGVTTRCAEHQHEIMRVFERRLELVEHILSGSPE